MEMIEELAKVNKLLEDMTSETPIFNNSTIYQEQKWLPLDCCDVEFPVQRKLTNFECVFDIDHVSEMDMIMIPRWLNDIGFKFIAWASGPEGLHIHFWTDIQGKEAKKNVTSIMAKNIEEKFGVLNDLGPMGHGHIRAEFSMHPIKGYKKTFIMSNISPLFYKNELSTSMRKKVSELSSSDLILTTNSSEVNGKSPKCIRYMLSHQFSDGRERIVFSLVSWWKDSGLTDDEIFDNTIDWCNKQNYTMSPSMIKAKIRSSGGKVGCRYRHNLLEEIGYDVGKCNWK